MNAYQIRQLIDALEAIEQQELAKDMAATQATVAVDPCQAPIIAQEPELEAGEVEVDEAGRRRKLLAKWGLA